MSLVRKVRYSLSVAVIAVIAHRSGRWPHRVRSAIAAAKSRTIAARESIAIGLVTSGVASGGLVVAESAIGLSSAKSLGKRLDSVSRAQPVRPRMSAKRNDVVRDNSASADSSDVTTGMCVPSVPCDVNSMPGRGGSCRR